MECKSTLETHPRAPRCEPKPAAPCPATLAAWLPVRPKPVRGCVCCLDESIVPSLVLAALESRCAPPAEAGAVAASPPRLRRVEQGCSSFPNKAAALSVSLSACPLRPPEGGRPIQGSERRRSCPSSPSPHKLPREGPRTDTAAPAPPLRPEGHRDVACRTPDEHGPSPDPSSRRPEGRPPPWSVLLLMSGAPAASPRGPRLPRVAPAVSPTAKVSSTTSSQALTWLGRHPWTGPSPEGHATKSRLVSPS